MNIIFLICHFWPLWLFSSFSSNCKMLNVDFSGIQTRIVRVEGEHADHLTTTTAHAHIWHLQKSEKKSSALNPLNCPETNWNKKMLKMVSYAFRGLDLSVICVFIFISMPGLFYFIFTFLLQLYNRYGICQICLDLILMPNWTKPLPKMDHS